jgi:phage FluMu gp28-like protein
MSAIYPFVNIDSESILCTYFLPYQVAWILAEDRFHAQKQQVFALAEKSVRIGWTYADAFKNVRKRLRFKNRDYLFATKDYPSALEYTRIAKEFADVCNLTKAIVSHGEEYLKAPADSSGLTRELKMSYIKFDTGSRIIAFSAHPQAMAVYGGDVGLDEFAKHPNAELLWQTAQGRVTWGYDMAVWSSHEGDDTLFNQFAQQARAATGANETVAPKPPSEGGQARLSLLNPNRNLSPSLSSSHLASSIHHPESDLSSSRITHHDSDMSHLSHSSHASHSSPSTLDTRHSSPWNLYFRVTITDAIELGLLDLINDTRDTNLTPAQFLADCRARAGLEQIFQQSYLCNPVPGGASIVEWSAIERCRSDCQIERVHLEASDIIKLFGDFSPHTQSSRQSKIEEYLHDKFPSLLNPNRNLNLNPSPQSSHASHLSRSSRVSTRPSSPAFRLGFDVAASGAGDLAAFYIDEARADDLWLRALLTCRTEDWDFIRTVLFYFLDNIPRVQAAGDESGLGRQICWEAANQRSYRFQKVNFAARKHDLGFTLMNQLATAQKHFPRDHHDIAADFFALRKIHTGTKWIFTEGRNTHNTASHCDIAWAAALATFAHTNNEAQYVYSAVINEDGSISRFGHRQNSGELDHPTVWRPRKL